ncbi:hypothetical protein JXI42_10040 [bacterium]|nr:hypothetical protein [bacterium]
MDNYLDRIKDVEEELEKDSRTREKKRKEEIEQLKNQFIAKEKETQVEAENIIKEAKSEAEKEAKKEIEKMREEHKKQKEKISSQFSQNLDNATSIILEEIVK